MADLKSFDEFNVKKDTTSVTEGKQKIKTFAKKNDLYYWNMFDEDGKRFDIPLLSPKDNEYRDKYIEAMKLKEEDPEAFARMLKWS